MMIKESTKAVVIIVSLVLTLFSACEKTSSEPEVTFFEIQGENGFVGRVEGTNAFISILLGEEVGIVYACNGEEDISEWFMEPVTDLKEISFTNDEGASITANFIDKSFKGEVVLRDNRKFLFDTEVNTGIYGGIYQVLGEEAVEAEIDAGWIVKSEADQRGSFKIKNVTQPGIALSGKNIKDLQDGLSNTVNLSEITKKSFSFFRYKVKTPTSQAPYTLMFYPNSH